jgi:hypothetical protein
MYQDFKDLLCAFHAHGIKYLIVGGYAVSFHAQPRAAKDIDLSIKDLANAKGTGPFCRSGSVRYRGGLVLVTKSLFDLILSCPGKKVAYLMLSGTTLLFCEGTSHHVTVSET